MSAERYFDHAASTPIHPEVFEAMLPYLRDEFGNANSPHGFGLRARDAVERARAQLASAISSPGCSVAPQQIIFTSGSTEANNWVLKSFERIVFSPFEHASVREVACQQGGKKLANQGHALADTADMPDLASVMSVNNETGARYDVRLIHAKKRHSDITQEAVKYECHLEGIDYASLSSHKFNGPKGVGALYCLSGRLAAYMGGGEQEGGMRSGTLNVPGIVGMGAAAAIGERDRESNIEHTIEVRYAFLNSLDMSSGVQLNTPENAVPHILSVSYEGLDAGGIVVGVDAHGFAVSGGSACSTHSEQSSKVLAALGVGANFIGGTVRVSFGISNTKESASDLAKCLNEVTRSLRNMRR